VDQLSRVNTRDAAAVELLAKERQRQFREALSAARLIESASIEPMPPDATLSVRV